MRHGFVDERALIINIFLSLKNPCTFLLAKGNTSKCIFNTNSELSQNRTEKQIITFKTTVNWLFNDKWCHLVIGCFGWKIGVFQQIVVRGLFYFKFQNRWRQNLVNRQLQYTYCSISHKVKAIRKWNLVS